ncbi:MAG: LytR family transcriptional regulator [Streptosporangiales bacterium]|nr:LytR family transcriptional regulator [Streptosporangiales bacterium]
MHGVPRTRKTRIMTLPMCAPPRVDGSHGRRRARFGAPGFPRRPGRHAGRAWHSVYPARDRDTRVIMSDRTGGSGGQFEKRRTSRTGAAPGRTYGRPRSAAPKRGDVAFRRALVVTLLSVVAPGSGHLALRHHRVGRVALRTYLVLVVLAVLAALFVPRSAWLAMAFKPWLLAFVQGLAVIVGALWAGVVMHAFWLTRPRQITSPRRSIAMVLALVLCLGIFAPFGVASRYAAVQRDLVTSMFPDSEKHGPKGRINVLLAGGDAGADRVGTRTDTMIVASIDLATGRTALISLPRNLEQVPMPGKLQKRFPNGFNDLLNAVYGYGEAHPDAVPGNDRPGPELLKKTIGDVLDLPIHYYLMVNLKGFTKIIDALGGVTVTVRDRLPIGGGTHPITGYIEPGRQKLTGEKALWYARSRAASSDYDRMTRQRCLLGALTEQADPATVLARYQQLAAASKQLFETDIPQNVLSELSGVAEKTKRHRLKSVTFTPPLIDTGDPDWDLIERKTEATIKASMKNRKKPRGQASKVSSKRTTGAAPTASPTGAVSVDSACR